MDNPIFLKVVCVDENDPLEYNVLEDVNRGSIEEALDFVDQNFSKHNFAKWILIPYAKYVS